jgi:hypothetical protein
MLYFPQLASGATVQFPLQRRIVRRSIVNRMADGTFIKVDDPNATGILWTLQYQGLSDAERSRLENVFCEAEGRRNPFVFLDPCGNLLTWSENFSNSAWHKDGAIQLASAGDPNGDERATRITNAAQTTQGIEQTVEAPGWFRYCFSFQARAAARTRVEISISNGDGGVRSEHFADAEWRLLSCSGEIQGSAESITCGFAIGGGTAVELFGSQLAAQPGPSEYRLSRGASGVYRNSRFCDDELRFVANGIDDHAVALRVFSRAGKQQ